MRFFLLRRISIAWWLSNCPSSLYCSPYPSTSSSPLSSGLFATINTVHLNGLSSFVRWKIAWVLNFTGFMCEFRSPPQFLGIEVSWASMYLELNCGKWLDSFSDSKLFLKSIINWSKCYDFVRFRENVGMSPCLWISGTSKHDITAARMEFWPDAIVYSKDLKKEEAKKTTNKQWNFRLVAIIDNFLSSVHGPVSYRASKNFLCRKYSFAMEFGVFHFQALWKRSERLF